MTMNELQTLRSLVDQLCTYDDRPAFVALRKNEVDVWAFSKVTALVQRLARGLVDAGLDKGVPAALLASTRAEWMIACLAVIHAGGVAVPLDVQLSDDGLIHA